MFRVCFNTEGGSMRLLAKFNLILLVVFGCGALAISHFAYAFLISNAKDQVLQQAQLMVASAKSVRDYISDDISPLLEQNPRHRVHFLAETIPYFGATTTFNNLRKQYPEYSYKEAALNPTNLEDRATDWESDVIHHLRDQTGEGQLTGVRSTSSGEAIFVADPIKARQECLRCHSSPTAAPPAMLTVYGSANGFGWKKDEIIGAQVISVPMSVPIQIANQAYHRLILLLVAVMLLAIAGLDAGVFWFVIRPLRIVSNNANRVSRGEKDVPSLRIPGNDEIAVVAASFNRMQVSLAKALRMLDKA
jgi:protein-histidine pros-kinase